MKKKIHLGTYVPHPIKPNFFVMVAMCGKKHVDVIGILDGRKFTEVNCKNCIKISNLPKHQCESPL